MHHVVILLFDEVELLDLAGPQTAFNEASSLLPESRRYHLECVAATCQPLASEAGLRVLPDSTLAAVSRCDTLLIPGGQGARKVEYDAATQRTLRALIARSQRVCTVCTGSFLLASLGLQDLQYMTTHWAFIDELRKLHPHLNVDDKRLYVNQGKYWSSAGVTAGIDMTLKLIELDHGAELASRVAKHLVVYVQRHGSQQQFSEWLTFQSVSHDKLKKLLAWLQEHLSNKINNVSMASAINVSERQLFRLVKQHMATTPLALLERLRIERARMLLATSEQPIKAIGLAVGYQSYDSFRRVFERHMGVSPGSYRQHFAHTQYI